MKKIVKANAEEIFERILLIMIFAVVFMGGTVLVEYIYSRHFDYKSYYQISSPVQVDKDMYKPGDNVALDWNRTSLIDIDAQFDNELILVKENGIIVNIVSLSGVTPIHKGTERSVVNLTLPKDLEDGQYRWQGILSFQHKGTNKTYPWSSEYFYVQK